MADVATIDFHVTSACSQACSYCWGPRDVAEVDTDTACAIIAKIASDGARRIVFTGGDPLQRADTGLLIRCAKEAGLEVALSTTGDELTESFLDAYAADLDLVSLPLDGASEEVSSRTKEPGHFTAVMRALRALAAHPRVDVKVATPVTRSNIDDVPSIVALLDDHASRLPNRLFYNVFHAFPRSMSTEVDWEGIVVSDEEFARLRSVIGAAPHAFTVNWLGHETLDRLYVMVFPDGTLTVPSGSEYRNYGSYLDIDDLDEVLRRSEFDAPKHLRHAAGWRRGTA